MKRIIAIAALLNFAAVADAGCAVVHRAVVKQQVVVAPVVQALAVAVPAYGAGYSPQPADPELLRQLLEEIRAMRAELRAALQQGQPAQPAQEPSAAALLDNSCAKCHKAGDADSKGGGFVMVEADGKLSLLSLEHKNRIARRIQNGSMPPAKSVNRPLSDAERKSLVEFFTKPKE